MPNKKEEARWQAVLACDKSWDEIFWYGVKTVGVYCRPSCKSRPPLRKNIRFFATITQAEAAGFRPCKRCRPDLPHYNPAQVLARRAKVMIEEHLSTGMKLSEQMTSLGASANHMAAIFKKEYGLSPRAYRDELRVTRAKALLAAGQPVAEVAQDCGFESLSAFYRFFRRHQGTTPRAYSQSPWQKG